jgi:hypothetical protein
MHIQHTGKPTGFHPVQCHQNDTAHYSSIWRKHEEIMYGKHILGYRYKLGKIQRQNIIHHVALIFNITSRFNNKNNIRALSLSNSELW